MSKKLLFGFFLLFCAARGLAWTDGELLIWISDDSGYRALDELGKKFEQEMGVSVKVETQGEITNKFQVAAQSGKGPDIFFWAHDRNWRMGRRRFVRAAEDQGGFQGGVPPHRVGGGNA